MERKRKAAHATSCAGPRPLGRAGIDARRTEGGGRASADRPVPPTRTPGQAAAHGHRSRQVFGLVDPATGVTAYCASLPSPGASAIDAGRFHLPLRGSPGLPPGSLLSRPWQGATPSTGTTYAAQRDQSTQDFVKQATRVARRSPGSRHLRAWARSRLSWRTPASSGRPEGRPAWMPVVRTRARMASVRIASRCPNAGCGSVGEGPFFWFLFFGPAKKRDSGAPAHETLSL